jgi:hypothetical protein
MKDVDARDKPGHDGWVGPTWMPATSARSKASSPRPGTTAVGRLDTITANSTRHPATGARRPARTSVMAPARSLRHGRASSRPSTFFVRTAGASLVSVAERPRTWMPGTSPGMTTLGDWSPSPATRHGILQREHHRPQRRCRIRHGAPAPLSVMAGLRPGHPRSF